MGKRKNKKKGKNAPPVELAPLEDRTKPDENPIIIPAIVFEAISDYMLQLAAPHRNVFLSVSEFDMADINPMHLVTKDSPTHMMVFCLRLITRDYFCPLAVVQINKRVEYLDKLRIAWEAFIQDLSIIRLNIIGSLSPPSPVFKHVLSRLTKYPNLDDHSGPIIYSAYPYKEIVHFYDLQCLARFFQAEFYDRIDLHFISRSPSQISHAVSGLEHYSPSWTDVLLTMATCGTRCQYTDEEVPTELWIFEKGFQESYSKMSASGLIRTDTKSSTDRMMYLFWNFTNEMINRNVDMTPNDLENLYNSHEDLRIALATLKFRSVGDKNLKDAIKNMQLAAIQRNRKVSKKVPCATSLFSTNFEEKKCNKNSAETPFDIFLKKFFYDDYEMFIKTSSAVGCTTVESVELQTALNSKKTIAHDHDYLRKTTHIEDKSNNMLNLKEEYYNSLGSIECLDDHPIESENSEKDGNSSDNREEEEEELTEYFTELRKKHERLKLNVNEDNVNSIGDKCLKTADASVEEKVEVQTGHHNPLFYVPSEHTKELTGMDHAVLDDCLLFDCHVPIMPRHSCENCYDMSTEQIPSLETIVKQNLDNHIDRGASNDIKDPAGVSQISIFAQETNHIGYLPTISVDECDRDHMNAAIVDSLNNNNGFKGMKESDYRRDFSNGSFCIENQDTKFSGNIEIAVPIIKSKSVDSLNYDYLYKISQESNSSINLTELFNKLEIDDIESRRIALRKDGNKNKQEFLSLPNIAKIEQIKWEIFEQRSAWSLSNLSAESCQTRITSSNCHKKCPDFICNEPTLEELKIINKVGNIDEKVHFVDPTAEVNKGENFNTECDVLSVDHDLKFKLLSRNDSDPYNGNGDGLFGSNTKFTEIENFTNGNVSNNINVKMADFKFEPTETKEMCNQSNNVPKELDYEVYRKSLITNSCDNKSNCDIIYKDKDTFNKLYKSIPHDCEVLPITNDWLCTFKGFLKLRDILERRKVKYFRSNLFSVDHVTFYVALIQKFKNNISTVNYNALTYRMIDYDCAFRMLYSGEGIYILTQDDED